MIDRVFNLNSDGINEREWVEGGRGVTWMQLLLAAVLAAVFRTFWLRLVGREARLALELRALLASAGPGRSVASWSWEMSRWSTFGRIRTGFGEKTFGPAAAAIAAAEAELAAAADEDDCVGAGR